MAPLKCTRTHTLFCWWASWIWSWYDNVLHPFLQLFFFKFSFVFLRKSNQKIIQSLYKTSLHYFFQKRLVFTHKQKQKHLQFFQLKEQKGHSGLGPSRQVHGKITVQISPFDMVTSFFSCPQLEELVRFMGFTNKQPSFCWWWVVSPFH